MINDKPPQNPHFFVWVKHPIGTKSCKKCGLVISVNANWIDLSALYECEENKP